MTDIKFSNGYDNMIDENTVKWLPYYFILLFSDDDVGKVKVIMNRREWLLFLVLLGAILFLGIQILIKI